jgi:hypothetical protein
MFLSSRPSSYIVPQLPCVSYLDECPLTLELKALDRRRDEIRAQLADKDLMEQATKGHKSYAFGGMDPPTEYDKERWARRQSRRVYERANGVIVPPGKWDDDLDKHHETKPVPVPIPDDLAVKGYKAQVIRNTYSMTWNGYILLPEGHPVLVHGKSDYNFLGYESPKGLPSIPQEVTWFKGNEIGWDHTHMFDVSPTRRCGSDARGDYRAPFYNTMASDGDGYLTFTDIIRECEEMARALDACGEWLRLRTPSPCPRNSTCECERDHWVLKAPTTKAGKRTWAQIVKSD